MPPRYENLRTTSNSLYVRAGREADGHKGEAAMKGSEIHIRRWVATIVVLAALVGGGILATGLRNWTGRNTVGANSLPVTVEHNAVPVPLSSFSNGFASVLKPV